MRRVLVLTGPPGVGKSTLIELLVKRHNFLFPIPYTSRPPRSYEVEGTHYHFLSKSEMINSIKASSFVIWTFMLTHYYGYSRAEYYQAMNSKRSVVLYMSGSMAIEFQRRQLATLVFLRPPGDGFLSSNIQARGTSDETDKLRRFFHSEDLYGYLPFFDHVIDVQDGIENTFALLLEVLKLPLSQ